LNTSLVQVFVVDDFEPWRRYAISTLEARPGLHIVGEASDGFDAVEKAQELQPGLILLDIGLPTLNGIEAGKLIREKVPNAKIVFCSENRSWDITEEALRVGAGYVLKSEAGKDLLPAVEAALRGSQFLSSTLARDNLDGNKGHIPHNSAPKKLIAPLPPENVVIRHEVEFYPNDAALVDSFARLIQATLAVGNVVIVIATESHRTEILDRLKADQVDLYAATEQKRYIAVDRDETLAAIMVDDLPDPIRLAKLLGDLSAAAKGAPKHSPRVAICGECAPALLARGNSDAAIQLEHLWDKIASRYGADVLCGYLWSTFSREKNNSAFQRICAEHSGVQGRALGY
jgi:DNA-binding NarL/FixJ family response regulator